jgi:hypothetical protein
MRDVPARVGDLVQQVIPRVQEKEFIIESEKEQVVGKCYISEETLELHSQLETAHLKLPNTKRGIAKLLERACRVSGVSKWNPHLIRKYFFSVGCNLNINRDILRVLMFKSVSKDILTYILNKEELREAWLQIIKTIPLENKANGRVTDIEKRLELMTKVLKKYYKMLNALKPSETIIPNLRIDEMSEEEFLQEFTKD